MVYIQVTTRMLDSLIFSFQRGLEMIWKCHHSNVPRLGQASWWLIAIHGIRGMGTSIGRDRRSITRGFLTDKYDGYIYGYDSGNDSRNFQRTFHEHQTFQLTSLLMMLALKNLRVGKPWASTQDIHSSLWFLNATYTCIMHRSIESIRTDSCPKKMIFKLSFHTWSCRPHANMTKRPSPRINHDTPSYNLNNMKRHKLHKPW